MDHLALKALIASHPEYPAVDNKTLSVWVNEKAVAADRKSVTAAEVIAAVADNQGEYEALTDKRERLLMHILYLSVNSGIPTEPGNPVRARLLSILGQNTRQALAGIIRTQISRAENAGIYQRVRVGDVEYARSL